VTWKQYGCDVSQEFRVETEIMIAEASCREAMLAATPKLCTSAKSPCRNGEHAEDLIQATLPQACATLSRRLPAPAFLNMVSENDGPHKVVIAWPD
jgi:hypothetical protein